MAKKKSSKKSLKILSFVKYGAIAFAVVGLVMTVFTFAKFGEEGYTGLQQIFGYSIESEPIFGPTIVTPILKFSFMTLLAVVLPLIGSISIFFKNKIIRAVGVVVMIAGCVLTFLAPNFVVYANSNSFTDALHSSASLGIGAILAGVFFCVGTLCCLFSVVEDKVTK